MNAQLSKDDLRKNIFIEQKHKDFFYKKINSPTKIFDRHYIRS